MSNNNLEGWVFAYNPYVNQWWAAKREHYRDLWNGGSNVLKSESWLTLQEIIMKTNGDPEKIEKLLENNGFIPEMMEEEN
jgi:hypothetical protein